MNRHDSIPSEVPQVDASGAVEQPLPEIVDGVGFLETEIETPPELVRGILHKGTKMVLGGGSKCKKTWTLTQLAVCVATGSDWLGYKTYQGRTLYINLEIPPWAFRRRVEAICAALKAKSNQGLNSSWNSLETGQLSIWNLRGHAEWAEKFVPRITDRIRNENYDIIIIDPLYKCQIGRDENSVGEMGLVLNQLDKLAVQIGAAVVFGHHFSKGNQANKEPMDRISGTGAFARDPDTIMTMTPHKDEGALVVETTLRNLPKTDSFCIRWEYPIMLRDDSLEPSDLKTSAYSKRTPKPEEFVALFPQPGIDDEPEKCLLSKDDLSMAFEDKGYLKSSAGACCKRALRMGQIDVIEGLPRNQKLYGLPEAVEAYIKAQERKSRRSGRGGSATCRRAGSTRGVR